MLGYIKIMPRKQNGRIKGHDWASYNLMPTNVPPMIEVGHPPHPYLHSLHACKYPWVHTCPCSMSFPCKHKERPDAPALPEPSTQPVTLRGTRCEARGKRGGPFSPQLMRAIVHHDHLSQCSSQEGPTFANYLSGPWLSDTAKQPLALPGLNKCLIN